MTVYVGSHAYHPNCIGVPQVETLKDRVAELEAEIEVINGDVVTPRDAIAMAILLLDENYDVLTKVARSWSRHAQAAYGCAYSIPAVIDHLHRAKARLDKP